jgi:hypothetical protein
MARSLLPTLLLTIASGLVAQQPKPPDIPELQKALAKAKVHNQRVLVVLTDAERDIAATLKKDRKVSQPLLYEFATVQLVSEQAKAFAAHWRLPEDAAKTPAMAVLDVDGKLLASVASSEFLVDGAIAGPALLDKLKPFYCTAVDAEKKLTHALAEAKRDGRAVFIRFDAPW